MMRIDILTLFPEMCEAVMSESIIGRARKKGAVEMNFHQIRDFAINNYGSVDDTQFGGGAGMVMRPDCLGDALDSIENRGKIIYFSPPLSTYAMSSVCSVGSLSAVLSPSEGDVSVPAAVSPG